MLEAFLQKVPHKISQEGRLARVLGIFNMLVSSPRSDELGFYVLNTVIDNLEYDVIDPYHGPAALVDTMNTIQPTIFRTIVEQFWIPNLKLITGAIGFKLTAVASTRLICESPVLLDPSAVGVWGKMLDSIVTSFSRPEEDRVEEEPEMPDIAENVGYTATFVNLYNAGKKEEDPLKDIKDPKEYLVASLARISATSPGRFPQIINENLDSANREALLQLCSTYNFTIV
ncbi:hypothetical protein Q3G72_004071 [Acer saccharum]|nr:hypothetical protein Q3G72_004071 [Acer saccharum]